MRRVYISIADEGWYEIEIPKEFKNYCYDMFVSNVHKLLQNTSYKGLLITENPLPFFSDENIKVSQNEKKETTSIGS